MVSKHHIVNGMWCTLTWPPAKLWTQLKSSYVQLVLSFNELIPLFVSRIMGNILYLLWPFKIHWSWHVNRVNTGQNTLTQKRTLKSYFIKCIMPCFSKYGLEILRGPHHKSTIQSMETLQIIHFQNMPNPKGAWGLIPIYHK